MALPNSNISVAMVKAELGASTNDVGQLCIHPNINKWSKNKPISSNKLTGLTSADRLGSDYGLVPPTTQTNYTPVYSQNWIYNIPTGGVNSPYRLGDFIGYEHLATPIAALEGNITINRTMTSIRPLILTMRRYGTDTLLGVDDYSKAGGISSGYYAAVFVKNGVEYIQSAKGTLGSGAYQIELDLTKAPFDTDETIQVYHVIINEMVDPIALRSTMSLGYRSLPTADNVSNLNTIQVMGGLGIDLLIEKIAGEAYFDDLMYMNINPFASPSGQSFPSVGGAWFKISLYNLSSDPIIVPLTGWNMNVSPNYWGANSNYLPATVYDGNFNSVPSVTVPPAGGSSVIYIGSDTVLHGGVSYLPSTKDFYGTVNFRYNTTLIISQGIRFVMYQS